MAPESITQDRIYTALKADYLSGRFRPNIRIDLQAAAERHRASTTPVREAVHRLIGERLLEPHPEGGFQIAIPEPTRLAHLYAWFGQQILSGLHGLRVRALSAALEGLRSLSTAIDAQGQAERAANIYEAIAAATGNSEIRDLIANANERLHYIRLAESLVLPNTGRELQTLIRNGHLSTISNLRRRVIAYHERRILHSAEITSAIRELELH